MSPGGLACSDPGAAWLESEPVETGRLQLGLSRDLDGTRYRLSGVFRLFGPEVADLDATLTEDTLRRELTPGEYTLYLDPTFQIFKDTPNGSIPVAAELLTPRDRAFVISAGVTTTVGYRFLVAGEVLELGSGTLEITFDVERAAGRCEPPIDFASSPPIPVGDQPLWIASADLDADGLADLVTSNQNGRNVSVLYGSGAGQFEPGVDYPVGAVDSVSQGELADLDNDGLVDIVVGTSAGVSLLYNLGQRRFAAARELPIEPIIAPAAADVTGDGWVDLVFASTDGVRVLRGTGDGSIEAPSGFLGVARANAIADIDADGDLDLATTDGNDSVSIWRNRGDGSFELSAVYPTGFSPISLALADLNADGQPDLVSANFGGDVAVLLNEGAGRFGPVTAYPLESAAYWLAVADLTLDGAPELIGAVIATDRVTVLHNAGAGQFDHPVDYIAGQSPTAVTAADLDGDGGIDLAVASYNFGDGSVPAPGVVHVLFNACAPPP